jgi:hypothetical protein
MSKRVRKPLTATLAERVLDHDRWTRGKTRRRARRRDHPSRRRQDHAHELGERAIELSEGIEGAAALATVTAVNLCLAAGLSDDEISRAVEQTLSAARAVMRSRGD